MFKAILTLAFCLIASGGWAPVPELQKSEITQGNSVASPEATQLALNYFSGRVSNGSTPPPPPTPTLTTLVASPSSGNQVPGTAITFTATFSLAVTVAGGTPTLNLATTPTGTAATYASGSGSTALVFNYTTGSNLESPLTTTASAISLNGATIRNGTTNAVLTAANSKTFTGLNVVGSPPPPVGATCPTGNDYYVSASGGNDANNGRTVGTAWASIAKVNASSFPANTCVHALTNLVGNLILDGSKMSGVMGFDCAGNTITAAQGGVTAAQGGVGVQAVYLTGMTQGVNFLNCNVLPATGAAFTQYGIKADNGTSGFIAGNTVGGFTLPNGNGDAANNIKASGKNLTITQNLVTGRNGVGSRDDTGIRLDSYTGDITVTWNTVLNIGGRSFAQGASNGYSGNGILIGYPDTPCDVQGNCTITIEHNLVHDVGGNTSNCGGPSGILAYEVISTMSIGYNEVHHVQPINPATQWGQPPSYGCDWDGIDLDGGVSNATVHDNYTHDNYAAGLLAWMGDTGMTWGPNNYFNNYSKNDYTSGANNGYWGSNLFAVKGGTNQNVRFEGNYMENTAATPGTPVITWSDSPFTGSGSTFKNNTIVARTNAILGQCDPPTDPRQQMTFSGNHYCANSFTMGQNCGGVYPSTLAAWASSVKGGEAGSTFGPVSTAPAPPSLPLAGKGAGP